MTETTKERIENARKRLDKAEKWEFPTMDQNFFAIVELADEVKKLNDMNTSLSVMMTNKISVINKLKAELAALKEKYRWRKQSEEPAPEGEVVEAIYLCEGRRCGTFYAHRNGSELKHCSYWRPLDLPGMGEAK